MSSEALTSKKAPSSRTRKKTSQSKALEVRRRLEERLEDIKLERQLREFDFEY